MIWQEKYAKTTKYTYNIAYAITTEIKSTFECNMHEMLELPFRYLQTKVSSFQKFNGKSIF